MNSRKPRKPLTPDQENLLRKLVESNADVNEIAAKLGVSYNSAYAYCKARNLQVNSIRRYRKWTDEELELMEVMKPKELAQKLGIKASVVQQKKRNALLKGQIENRWREEQQDFEHLSDEDMEAVEEKYCVNCKRDNPHHTCRILSRAYRNHLPKQWQLDKTPVCSKFERK